VEPEHDLAGRCLEDSTPATYVPRSAQSPLIHRKRGRWTVGFSCVLSESFWGCETFAATIADVGLGRSFVSAGRCLNSVRGYANDAPIQTCGSVLLQKFLDDALGLAIFTLPEVVISYSSFPIDELVCRPVFVVGCIPNPMVAVDGDWVCGVQFANGFFYVPPFSLESELWRMYADHYQARILNTLPPPSLSCRVTLAGC